MNYTQKALIQPFAQQLADMEASLENVSDEEIELIQSACSAASQTNCWAYTFRAAQLLLPMIRSIKIRRASLPTSQQSSGGEE